MTPLHIQLGLPAPLEPDLTAYPWRLLVNEFGEKNVENACIFVLAACTPKGLLVRVKLTPEMIRSVLEAVHGRMDVGAVRVSL